MTPEGSEHKAEHTGDSAEGGAEAASATSASAKWVLDYQQPPSAPQSEMSAAA